MTVPLTNHLLTLVEQIVEGTSLDKQQQMQVVAKAVSIYKLFRQVGVASTVQLRTSTGVKVILLFRNVIAK